MARTHQSRKSEKATSAVVPTRLERRPPQSTVIEAAIRPPAPAFGGISQELATGLLQAKLTVGAAGDKYEQEADRVAAQVVDSIHSPPATNALIHDSGKSNSPQRLINASIQRHENENEDNVQLKLAQHPSVMGGGAVSDDFDAAIRTKRGTGQALAPGLQHKMGQLMGADFSRVQIHTDHQSHQLNQSIQAKAFTTGQDIFFRQGAYNPASRAGQTLIAHELTHVVQQKGGLVQRHPSHAEEEEVRAKFDIQCHPSHAEEEEVRAKYFGAAPAAITVQERSTQNVIRAWPFFSNRNRRRREQALTQKYGFQIGGGPKALPNGVLNKLDEILTKIPSEHLTHTHLKSIQLGDGIGAASAYTQDSNTSGHIGIVVPPHVPDWLYPLLSKAVLWQRKIMNRMAVPQFAEKGDSISKNQDEILGLDYSKREIFAGVSDVLSKGNLLEWTILHEMGHAVDHKIKFTENKAKETQFGGWRQYQSQNEQAELANIFLKKTNIDIESNDEIQDPAVRSQIKKTVSSLLQPSTFELVISMLIASHDAAQKERKMAKWQEVLKMIRIARSQPWMFPDGGASKIQIDDRVYHLDHYGTWVSYLVAERTNHGLSNYQFSSPGEWFAEAYAAYYDPKRSVARNRLNQATRHWFAEYLSTPPNREGQREQGRLVKEADVEVKDLSDIVKAGVITDLLDVATEAAAHARYASMQ